ncbi:ABC transporter integral membrane type 1 [Penicillium malachiteum]|uniref:ABC transporter integral membrane type 1 n=1 Tax=Penicillium malachiteum TaxID=1324776 RepID=UPI002547B9BD|nr:ABC transporter integral membrane type 1 [Penicillium malachiteum]KAJ5714937.1 ABC transporter integral membrane type 1 [Penicillium malachiteum]
MALSCSPTADTVFGPQVSTACRSFDFTLYFEDIFLTCLPAACLILLAPVELWLLRKTLRQVQRSLLLKCKLAALGALFACQFAFTLVRQLRTPVVYTNASLPSDVVELIAISNAILLSYFDHCQSVRPSTFLVLYLSSRSLLGLARIRTLWLIPGARNAAIPKRKILVPNAEKPKTPEPFSGIWKRASFLWLAATFRRGYVKVMSVHDLPELDPKLNSQVVARELQDSWSQVRDKSAKYALLRACFQAYLTPFLSGVLPRLLVSGFTFCQPFLMNSMVSWTEDSDAPMYSGKAMIGAYALVYMGMAASTALYGYYTFRATIRLRGGLVSLIHRQTINARGVDLGETTAITLMGTDVERIATGFRSIHDLWGCPIDIGIAIYLLERQVGVACLVPSIIAILFILATFKLSSASNKFQRQWVERVEERLRFTSYSLENTKAVKMLGLSEKVFSMIQQLRRVEIATSAVFRKLLVGVIVLSNSPADIAPMATFVVYVIIALVKQDNTILAAQAFTSLSLISLLTTPILDFIQSVPQVIQCLGCLDRIQEYASVPGLYEDDQGQDKTDGKDTEISLQNIRESTSPGSDLVKFSNYSAGWKHGASSVVREIELSIQKGSITMVVGPIGSGKSTLLDSMLGETVDMSGNIEQNVSRIGYCSQTPWLQGDSIRNNIIGSSPTDTDWYTTVVTACGLSKDLAQLNRGDQTILGNSGLTISGGQRQRIALARALYARSKFFLLDDVFSGVDATTTESIASSLMGVNGLFRQLQSTVVLATHSGFLLQYADIIFVLNNGTIVDSGSLTGLQSRNSYIQELKATGTMALLKKESDETLETAQELSHETKEVDVEDDEFLNDESSTDPTRQGGDLSIYAYYISASGRTSVTFFIAMVVIWAFCREFSTIWLDIWTAANAKSPNSQLGKYIGIYIMLSLIGIFFMVAGCWIFFVRIVSKSALQLHGNLADTTMRASFRFFLDVDIGSIINRQDMDLIDMGLPLEALNFIGAGATCIVQVIIIAVYAKYLGIIIPFLAIFIYMIQRFYLRTSRQIRHLDIEAKAPLYTHFLEIVSGATTIRAFRWQEAFDKKFTPLLDLSQRPVYMLYCIQQGLGFVLDSIVAVMAVALVAIVVILRRMFNPGDVGVALTMLMTFNSSLMQLIKFWTRMETSIGAVARVKNFVATTEPEESDIASQVEIPASWPMNGSIKISDITASYSPESPPVLQDISMNIKSGENIAICGSSGSGKSSLILTLLRMIEIQQGSIIVDGIDISKCSQSELRTRLNVVTQDPFIVPGSVRFNIDPFEMASDDAIITVLRRVGLYEKIEEGGGLDMEMNSESWSMGQRQLLCLTRAMLRGGKLLILDEATSSVDHQTEELMQEIFDTEFSSHTILSVLHRLRYIHRYDRVAVLESGSLVEFDSSTALLSRDSRFAALYNSGSH